MKFRRFLFPVALAVLTLSSAHAQDAATDFKALFDQIQTKLKAGERTPQALAPELKAFDALVDKYKGEKTDEVAQISFMRAMFYLQVFQDAEKGKALLTQVKTDFPGTKPALAIDRVLDAVAQQSDALAQQAKAKEVQSAIVGKAAPELHFTWSTQDGLKSLSSLKGKLVVIDFWATWCGPCIASFPEVRELVNHYKGTDVVVLGVTSIQGRVMNLEAQPIDTKGNPAKEMSLMPAFIKAKEMTWTVAFSDEPVFNLEYGITGIPHMTIIAPDGTVRHNDLHPAMPHAEKTAKIDAILKEFSLPLPGAKKS